MAAAAPVAIHGRLHKTWAPFSILLILHCILTAAASPHGAPVASSAWPLILPLQKQQVPVIRNKGVVMQKTAYSGTIYMGSPAQQKFSVVLDTGSGHVFVPSSKCRSEPCRKHRTFDRNVSASAVDVDHEGKQVSPEDDSRDEVAIAYGTGEIEGEMVREMVCLSPLSVPNQTSLQPGPQVPCAVARVILAIDMSTQPFSEFEFDGVLGLGLEMLSLDPEFNLFAQLLKHNADMEPRFGVYLARSDATASEISLGGHDERRMSGELRWAPVVQPDLGYWLVRLLSVRVGNETLQMCREADCLAIADTGTSLLGVPQQVSSHLNWQLARRVEETATHDTLGSSLDCREAPGPDIVLDFGDDLQLTLGAEDYSRPAPLQVVSKATGASEMICRAQLLPVSHGEPLGSNVWLLGEPILQKYYSVFDWANRRIGFAPAVASPAQRHSPAAQGAGGLRVRRRKDKIVPTVVQV